ncbi:MAG: hypothetical protein ABL974_01645 [Prosthecobacter sp.]
MATLIVSRTRMHGNHVCIGGFDLVARRSVRLLNAQGYNQANDSPYKIGDLWNVSYQARPRCDAPHLEDVLVSRAINEGSIDDLPAFIRANCPIVVGPLADTFGGMLQFTAAGSGYLSRGVALPDHSVCFWQSAFALSRNDFNDKVRYDCRQNVQTRHIPYVGFQEPLAVIPAGTLLRLSLARWWKPKDAPPEDTEKCFLQLSGYYA